MSKVDKAISWLQLVFFLFILCLAFVAYLLVNVVVWLSMELYQWVSKYIERLFC
tara:strand:+ start:928 stop:1089 length:162 start_codon:yes stop_codon:yes gene_type:complete